MTKSTNRYEKDLDRLKQAERRRGRRKKDILGRRLFQVEKRKEERKTARGGVQGKGGRLQLMKINPVISIKERCSGTTYPPKGGVKKEEGGREKGGGKEG